MNKRIGKIGLAVTVLDQVFMALNIDDADIFAELELV